MRHITTSIQIALYKSLTSISIISNSSTTGSNVILDIYKVPLCLYIHVHFCYDGFIRKNVKEADEHKGLIYN